MSQRITRLNELFLRDVNDILRTKFQTEAVYITAQGVKISHDLKSGKVFYSVLGETENSEHARAFFKQNAQEIRFQLGKRIVLKYMPLLRYVEDDSIVKGNLVLETLDEIESTNED